MAISDKHKRFAEEYCLENNLTQAYMKVYQVDAESARRASSRLMKNKFVIAEIARIRAEMTLKTGLSTEWVLNNLKTISDRCMQVEEVRDKDGNLTGVFDFDQSGANRANELIGKHFGMFKDKSEVEVKVTKKLEDFFS